MADDPILPYANVEKHEKDCRLGFIRKVTGILTCQLLFTVLTVLTVYLSKSITDFLLENFWIIYLCLGFYITISIVLICFKSISRTVPTNYILLSIFTISLSLITGIITTQYDGFSVLIAAILTLGVTIALTLFALFTKTDFTVCIGLIYVLSFSTIIVLILMLSIGTSNALYYFFCWLCVIFYGLFLIIDIQLVAGGKRYGLSHEDYIVGAMMIYIDIVMLFLEILKIFGKR